MLNSFTSSVQAMDFYLQKQIPNERLVLWHSKKISILGMSLASKIHPFYITKALSHFLSLFLFLSPLIIQAQPQKQYIDIQVSPTKQDWTYQLGDKVNFEVKVFKNRRLLPNITINYQIGAEQMPPMKEGELTLKKGSTRLKGYTLKQPGFLQCRVSVNYKGKIYRQVGTAAFVPEQIKATTQRPKDFDEFWANVKKELTTLPIDVRIAPQPELSTSTIDVYHISLQNVLPADFWLPESRVYGMLSVPKKEGKYPAILELPGAGVRAYGRDEKAAKGVIVLKIGIHGIPVNLTPKEYQTFQAGPLASYWTKGLTQKDAFYFKRVLQGAIRAIDYLFTMPAFDGKNLVVTGISQGGGLSIMLAGLDDRVNYLAVFYPGLGDLMGYLKGRAGGWPPYYKSKAAQKNLSWQNTTAYFDSINFLPNLKATGWYSWGYNDGICPPTSMYAVYNAITAPKELHIFQETGHWSFPEQRELMDKWLFEQFKKKK